MYRLDELVIRPHRLTLGVCQGHLTFAGQFIHPHQENSKSVLNIPKMGQKPQISKQFSRVIKTITISADTINPATR
jgi:hypothetical protein